MLGHVDDASDQQNHVVRIRCDGTTHGPMCCWVPARSAGEIEDASTTAVFHVDGHVVHVGYRRPVPQFNVDAAAVNVAREVQPGR